MCEIFSVTKEISTAGILSLNEFHVAAKDVLWTSWEMVNVCWGLQF